MEKDHSVTSDSHDFFFAMGAVCFVAVERGVGDADAAAEGGDECLNDAEAAAEGVEAAAAEAVDVAAAEADAAVDAAVEGVDDAEAVVEFELISPSKWL